MESFKTQTAEESARFWKEQATNYKSQLDTLRREFSEFEEDSKSLENELEVDLQQNVAKVRDLNACVIKLKNENEGLKKRLDIQNQNETRQHDDTMKEIASFKKQVDELKRYVRQLEQDNDKLERSYRASQASIDDFETKLNGVIERNVILEGELDEKDQYKAIIQRMRDETRDLRSELHVRSHSQSHDSNRTEVVQVPLTARPPRSTPISIVNDLLRKVGVIESKLTAYHRKDDQSKRKVFPAYTDSEPKISYIAGSNNTMMTALTPNTTAERKDIENRRGPFCCFSVVN